MVETRKKIRSLREIKGYSQEFMAEKLDISQRTYSKIESGQVKLDLERLKAIADLLEVEFINLLDDNATSTFNNYSKVKNFGNVYISSQDYIEHLIEENKYLKQQVERLMRMLEDKK